jgi:hypothetical protein
MTQHVNSTYEMDCSCKSSGGKLVPQVGYKLAITHKALPASVQGALAAAAFCTAQTPHF